MYLIADGGMCSVNKNNTFDAIMLTKNLDYVQGVKLDIQMTKDDILVLSKNDDLSIETLSNKKISEVNYDYLRKVKYPSHIFNYYIPTLEEILHHYHVDKIIVLEIHFSNKIDVLISKLTDILSNYSYEYYFLSQDDNILDKMKHSSLGKYGIVLEKDNKEIIITKYPEKFKKDDSFFDNNRV